MEAVESAHGDGRQPLADAALANLAQHFVLGAEDFLGPAPERGVALADSLVLRRFRTSHGGGQYSASPEPSRRDSSHYPRPTAFLRPPASFFSAPALSLPAH